MKKYLWVVVLIISLCSLNFFVQTLTSNNFHSKFHLIKKITDDPKGKFFFFDPVDILADQQNIFVLDSEEKNIKIFDKGLNYISSFSREGKGPGEMISAYNMEFDEKKNLVIYDSRNLRFTIFTREGKYSKNWNYTPIVAKFAIAQSGDYYIETMDYRVEHNNLYNYARLIKMSPDFRKQYVIDSSKTLIAKFVNNSQRVPIPFSNMFLWALGKDNTIITAESAEKKIKIFKNGILKKQIQFDKFRKIRVTEKDKKAYFDGFVISDGNVTSHSVPDYIVKNTSFPTYKAYFQQIFTFHDLFAFCGYMTADKSKAGYYIFNNNGEYLEYIELPWKIYNYYTAISNEHIYTIEKTEEKIYLAEYSFKSNLKN